VWSWLPESESERRRPIWLWGPVFAITLLCAIVAVVWWAAISHNESPTERVGRIAGMGAVDEAEQLSWKLLQSKPGDLKSWIRFIDAHAELLDGARDTLEIKPSVDEPAIRKLLGIIKDSEVATLASYWYEEHAKESKPDPAPITALADRPHPAQLANYLLGRMASENDDWAIAARRYEREGLAFPKEGTRHLRRAMALWIDHDAWDELRKRARDPRYAAIEDASFRLDLAAHDRDWPQILRWLWAASYVHVKAWPVALAILAAALWFVIATRLGRIADGVKGRPVLYALAFLLGIVSIYPTLLVIVVEEAMFGLKLMGKPAADAIYFIFGVGVREEMCKLILFLPLMPTLLRRGSRIEAMTCGALIGLGFAAEENVSYFHHLAPGIALSRFLTANFMHMSLTAIVALSVFDAARGRSTSRDRFDLVFPLAAGIHGAYDFFLGYFPLLSMVLFFFISQQFLRQLLIASSREEERDTLRLLVVSMALLGGVSYIYATTLVGPWIALRLIATGILGLAIVIYMFVRELGPA
jgi:RsiW-degrading membrane proteinase PrsW (M82 family)